MLIGPAGSQTSPGGPFEKPFLEQEWFVDVFDRIAVFPQSCSDSFYSGGAAVEFLNNGKQQFPVDLIESKRIYIKGFQCLPRYLHVDNAFTPNLRKIPYPFQYAIGNSRRAP